MTFIPQKQVAKRAQKRKDAGRRRLETALEEGLEETFPASDAVSVTQPRRQAVPVREIKSARS
jgi:hypothetical protein